MTGNIVARRYAKALFAVAAKQGEDDLKAFGKQLMELSGALADAPEALRFFKNPVFSAEEKKAVLGQLVSKLSLSPVVKNFCDLLADKGRLPELQGVAAVYGKMLDEQQGVISGELVTAIELADARKTELKDRLEKQTGRKLELDFAADPDILGGVVLKVGDRVLDASLRAQLQMMKETIKRGE